MSRQDGARARDGGGHGPRRDLYSDSFRVEADMTRTILFSIVAIAFTDIALQLDNALAISS
ncbi:MAG: hypothetical protein E6I67_07720, partial [Chloroflexi bacterium]